MIKTAFNFLIYKPLYNVLIFIVAIIPGADLGLAVVILTIIVKMILYPFSKKATESQILMKSVQGELDTIKNKYKDNKQEQAKQMMALYKEKNINPFSGILILFVQIPIILGLYWVILKGGFPEINSSLLYSFAIIPDHIGMEFLGLIDISQRYIIMAVLVGITQFIQMKFAMPPTPPKSASGSFKEDFARNMSIQMKYGMPIMVALITYSLPAVVGLYWVTSNLFAIAQELIVRKKMPWQKNSANQNTEKNEQR